MWPFGAENSIELDLSCVGLTGRLLSIDAIVNNSIQLDRMGFRTDASCGLYGHRMAPYMVSAGSREFARGNMKYEVC